MCVRAHACACDLCVPMLSTATGSVSGNVAHHSLLVKSSFVKFISLTVLKQHRISSQSDFKERMANFRHPCPGYFLFPYLPIG